MRFSALLLAALLALAALVAVSAMTVDSSLELEAGAEAEAWQWAELTDFLELDAEADMEAELETEVDAEAEAEAETEVDAEADMEAEAETEVEAEATTDVLCRPAETTAAGLCKAEPECNQAVFENVPTCGTGNICCVPFEVRVAIPVDAQGRVLQPPKDAKYEPPGATLAERAYAEAVKMLHVREVGGNNKGPDVDKIIKTNGGKGPEAWCGDFMAWCYRNAGFKRTTRIWCRAFGVKDAPGVKKTTSPVRGDMVVFRFSHIGMFVKKMNGNLIETIEGNTTPQSHEDRDSKKGGDGVWRKVRPTALVIYYLKVVE